MISASLFGTAESARIAEGHLVQVLEQHGSINFVRANKVKLRSHP